MKEVLEPLARIPGVRIAALVMDDGVPVAIEGQCHAGTGEGDQVPEEDPDVFTGMLAAWVADLRRQAGMMSWSPPERFLLEAARGTVMICRTEGSALLVLLDRGMRTADLALPLEGALQRLERVRREVRRPAPERLEQIPGIHPAPPSAGEETAESPLSTQPPTIHPLGPDGPQAS